jgi:hypothetical protein
MTNMTIPAKSALFEKGQALIEAAYEYWQEYQKVCESAAVVWLNADDGHLLVFTRGEYTRTIMECIEPLQHEEPMVHPFGVPDEQ